MKQCNISRIALYPALYCILSGTVPCIALYPVFLLYPVLHSKTILEPKKLTIATFCAGPWRSVGRGAGRCLEGCLESGHIFCQAGQVLVRSWSGPGQVLARSWSGPGQVLVRSWSGPRQVLVQSWPGPGQVLVRSCEEEKTAVKFFTFP